MRFIVCHLHRSSARLRFLNFSRHICGPEPLPKLVEIIPEPPASQTLSQHPSAHLNQLRKLLQLEESQLEVAPGFRCWIEAPGQTIAVYLVMASGPDPFVPPTGSEWIGLPECWLLTPLERDLLREVYEFLLG